MIVRKHILSVALAAWAHALTHVSASNSAAAPGDGSFPSSRAPLPNHPDGQQNASPCERESNLSSELEVDRHIIGPLQPPSAASCARPNVLNQTEECIQQTYESQRTSTSGSAAASGSVPVLPRAAGIAGGAFAPSNPNLKSRTGPLPRSNNMNSTDATVSPTATATALSAATSGGSDQSSESNPSVPSDQVVAPAERTPEEIAAAEALLVEKKGGPLKVLFLSADTGGGHRASAESLAKSFQMHYPGTTYDLLDVWTDHGVWPYKRLVPSYKHLASHPRQWRLFYHLSNNFFYEVVYDFHSWLTCERRIRRRISTYQPDVVVSVHPTMNNVPLISTRKISKKEGRHIPFFTVVTDFGSAHTTWFQRKIDKIFVASDRLAKLAKRRGRIKRDKLVMSGLPIRHDFAVQAERLGDRTTEQGRDYQAEIRRGLGLDPDRRMVLVMGGGEGVGLLSDIVDGLYAKFRTAGVDATICVVCGRNEKLQKELDTKDWEQVLQQSHEPKKRRRFLEVLRPHRSKRIQETLDKVHRLEEIEEESGVYHAPGKVNVVGLGFVTNMAEYMVAADVLVTKAGPGTIAEAAAVGLPVMLTSFLPGQEAGNVNVVLDGGFGDHCEDPDGIADEVSCWLQDSQLIKEMSQQARDVGHPHAASDIVLDIGESTHDIMRRNNVNGATGI